MIVDISRIEVEVFDAQFFFYIASLNCKTFGKM